jgi:ribosomal protein S20
MITGMLADKDTDTILDNFCGITDEFIAAEPDNPRKLTAEKLAEKLYNKGAKCIIAKDAAAATDAVKKVQKNIDKAVSKGVMKKNTADREKSRLNKKVKEMM